MIALDTNLLIYAHRSATPKHRAATKAADRLGYGCLSLQLLWRRFASADGIPHFLEAQPSEVLGVCRRRPHRKEPRGHGVVTSMPGGASRSKSVTLYVMIRSHPARSAQRTCKAS